MPAFKPNVSSFTLVRRQSQSDGAQGRHIVSKDQRIIVLQVQLHGRAQVRALGEMHEVLDAEHSLDDHARSGRVSCIRCIPRVVGHDGLLLAKVALAPEDELVVHAADLHVFGQVVHIATDLLEIAGGQGGDLGELGGIDLERSVVEIEEVQRVGRSTVLLVVFDLDSKVVGILAIDVEAERVVVVDGLDDLVEVEHIESHVDSPVAVIDLELGGIELQMHQDDAGGVHGEDLHPSVVELYAGVSQEVLERLHEDLEYGGLDGLDLETVIVIVRRHSFTYSKKLFMLERTSLCLK